MSDNVVLEKPADIVSESTPEVKRPEMTSSTVPGRIAVPAIQSQRHTAMRRSWGSLCKAATGRPALKF